MLYFYLATNFDNKYNQNFFYKYLNNITKHLETLTSLLKKQQINQIVNKCEKTLENDFTIKREVFNKIQRQLSNISLSQKKIKKAKKYAILN